LGTKSHCTDFCDEPPDVLAPSTPSSSSLNFITLIASDSSITMGDRKSGSSSKADESSSKSSTETFERAQMSPRSHSEPSTPGWPQGFSAFDESSSSKKERRPSEGSLDDAADDDEDNNEYDNNDEQKEDEEEKEEQKPSITKRHSTGHANVYTECGRHGDDWLFGGISDAVKTVKSVLKGEKK